MWLIVPEVYESGRPPRRHGAQSKLGVTNRKVRVHTFNCTQEVEKELVVKQGTNIALLSARLYHFPKEYHYLETKGSNT